MAYFSCAFKFLHPYVINSNLLGYVVACVVSSPLYMLNVYWQTIHSHESFPCKLYLLTRPAHGTFRWPLLYFWVKQESMFGLAWSNRTTWRELIFTSGSSCDVVTYAIACRLHLWPRKPHFVAVHAWEWCGVLGKDYEKSDWFSWRPIIVRPHFFVLFL